MTKATNMSIVLLLMLAKSVELAGINPPCERVGPAVNMGPILKTSVSLLQQILNIAVDQKDTQPFDDGESAYVIKYAKDSIVIEKEGNQKNHTQEGETTEKIPEETTEIVATTEFNAVLCRDYTEKQPVGNISMSAPWPEVAMSWYLNEGVSQDCFTAFEVRICQKRGECVSATVDDHVRRFATPVQNVTFYYSASIKPILIDGTAAIERSKGYEKLNVCPGDDAPVRNPTWTVTSNSIALSWLAPDAPAICIDHYFVTVIDEKGKTTGGTHLHDTHYTQEGLNSNMFYEVYITVFYTTGGFGKTALGTLLATV